MATGSKVALTTDQHSELSSTAQSRSLPAGYVFRTKLILMLSEGTSFNTIKRRLQISAPPSFAGNSAFCNSDSMGSTRIIPARRPRC
jgi:hypothetical protein